MVTTETENELKPCPFCGGNKIERFRPLGVSGKTWPQCMDCNGAHLSDELWNRRAEPDNGTLIHQYSQTHGGETLGISVYGKVISVTIPKPHIITMDWSRLHRWAKWIAMDSNGQWWAFGDKPSIRRGTFGWSRCGNGDWGIASPPPKTPDDYDWRESLTPVPEMETAV